VGLDGNDLVVEHPGLALGAHHERHVGTVHVHVDEADTMALLLEGQGQVDGHGGLANASFARRHGHRVLDLGDEIGRGRAGPGCLCHGEALSSDGGRCVWLKYRGRSSRPSRNDGIAVSSNPAKKLKNLPETGTKGE
jgi:hypothetical protein